MPAFDVYFAKVYFFSKPSKLNKIFFKSQLIYLRFLINYYNQYNLYSIAACLCHFVSKTLIIKTLTCHFVSKITNGM